MSTASFTLEFRSPTHSRRLENLFDDEASAQRVVHELKSAKTPRWECDIQQSAGAAQRLAWRSGLRYECALRGNSTALSRWSWIESDAQATREALCYLDGEWLPRPDARVRVEDRGLVFSDGVYEVVRFYNARPFTMAQHVERMQASLAALQIELDWQAHPLAELSQQLVAANAWPDAHVYWQVTRGVAARKHYFPRPSVAPTVILLAYPEAPLERQRVRSMRGITREDVRWKHCQIKSISLLANILDSEAAQASGVGTAVLVRDGWVTECPSRSLFMVEHGTLYSYPLDGTVLDSITRRVVLELAQQAGIAVREERFTLERLLACPEAFVVGTTTEVSALTHLDGRALGTGAPGPITTRLAQMFVARVAHECGML